MKPRVKIASAQTPDGSEMVLYQHDRDFSITINGQSLMGSRQHESELELARLACAHLVKKKAPCVLIGGLGLGYTLRQVLDMLSIKAHVIVGELLNDIVEWNHKFFGELNGQPLNDKRVEVKKIDIVKLLSNYENKFDAILLDVDNGPAAMTDSGNRRLYSREGIKACHSALSEKGCLAVWSAGPSKDYERLLVRCGFHVRRYRVPAYKGSKSQSRFIWVASENKNILPPGGGEPILGFKNPLKKNRRQARRNVSHERYWKESS